MKSKLLKITELHILSLLEIIALIKAAIVIFIVKDRDWEPDSYMHFLQLKSVYYDFPENVAIGITVWAKPLYTYLYALPIELFDLDILIIVQILNIIVFSITFYLIYRIGKLLFQSNNYALLSLCLSLFSYNLFKSSITALTEPIFTLCLILGYYLALKQRYLLAGLVFGISVLGRIEGLYFLGIYNLWIIYVFGIRNILKNNSDRKGIFSINLNLVLKILKIWVISGLPVLIWNFIGFIESGRLIYIFAEGYPTDAGRYGFGTILHFPRKLLIEETIIFLLFILGTFALGFSYRKLKTGNSRKELVLAWIFAAGFTLTQIYFWIIGQFGSAGLSRYLVSVLPFYTLIATLGIKLVFERFNTLNININDKFKFRYSLIGVLIALHLFLMIANFTGISPLSKKWIVVDQDVIDAGEFIKENYSNDVELNTSRPEVVYYADRAGNLNQEAQDFSGELYSRKPGIYVWDTEWDNVWGLTNETLAERASFVKRYDSMYIYEIK